MKVILSGLDASFQVGVMSSPVAQCFLLTDGLQALSLLQLTAHYHTERYAVDSTAPLR